VVRCGLDSYGWLILGTSGWF